MGAVRIAGKNEIGVACEFIEMQDVTEILGGLGALQGWAGLMAARAIFFQRIEGGKRDGVGRDWNVAGLDLVRRGFALGRGLPGPRAA